MSIYVIYAIFALVAGIFVIRMIPADEVGPIGVVIYFLLGAVFAPVILIFTAGALFIAGLQWIATVGRS